MKYPLNLQSKIIAIAPQIYVTDSDGTGVLYVKQKLLKLKEHVEVFTDNTKEKNFVTSGLLKLLTGLLATILRIIKVTPSEELEQKD